MCGVEPVEHLVGDLCVAGFVGAHQAKAVTTQKRGLPIEKEKEGKAKKNSRFADAGPTRQRFAPGY
jgi:hypothetical protein